MLESIFDEFKRSPIATISGVIGILSGAMTLVVAVIQNTATSTLSHDLSTNAYLGINVGNMLLIIAFFLSSSFAGATTIRFIARKHDFAALLLSVPLVSLINFLTILIVFLTPPRKISADLFSSAHDLVHYASITVFLTICGEAVLRDLVASLSGNKIVSNDQQKNEEPPNSASSVLLIALLIFVIWSSAISKGQSMLTFTFLPEVTHHIEKIERE